MTFYLGIDAGGTHTRARLTDERGHALGVGASGPANTRIGLPLSIRAIEEAADQAIAEAGLLDSNLAEIRAGIGIAGLNRTGVLKGLRAHPFNYESLAIASDAAIACLGAHLGEDGGIVVVGTGSIGFARVGEETIVVGGYGFPISDEGSGADLGLSAVRQSLWAKDGRIPHTPMTEAVIDSFSGLASEIVAWMDNATATDYAKFAPIVFDHANDGDAVAEPIVQRAAMRIDRLTRVLFDRGAPTCCMMGGVASRLHDWLAAGVRERLRPPKADALEGAILLAKMRGLPPGRK